MNVIYFFTSHRQDEEIAYNAAFFNNSNFLKRNVRKVVCWCNDMTKPVDALQVHMAKFDCETELIMSVDNAGWRLGSLQALALYFRRFEPFDYVLFLSGPDVYLANDEQLAATLIRGNNSDTIFHTFRIRDIDGTRLMYTFDLFAFKPQLISNIWEEYVGWPHEPERWLYERLNGVRHQPCSRCDWEWSTEAHSIRHETIGRFPEDRGNTYREIDEFGLWHEHDNGRVREFQKRFAFIQPHILPL